MTNLDDVFSQLDALAERLEEVCYHALDEYADSVTERLRDRLAIDYPPASVPGEFPHRRTGKLQAGIVHYTTQDGDSFNSVITSERPGGELGVPGKLNFEMNRPYMTDTYTLLLEEFPQEIRNILRTRI